MQQNEAVTSPFGWLTGSLWGLYRLETVPVGCQLDTQPDRDLWWVPEGGFGSSCRQSSMLQKRPG